jgi:uracil-DNA glycosylase family 4
MNDLLEHIRTEITHCQRCPRLRTHCESVAQIKKREFRDWSYWGRPVPGFGDPDARLLIVGLAPAAHGANRTGRMFTGDSSGNWLFGALHRYGFASQPASTDIQDGLVLSDCYISATARCAPPDNKPTREEIEACRPFLQAELEALHQVRLVVALGRIAWENWLKASGWWDQLTPSARPVFGHGVEWVAPNGTTLICSYHPSRQNTNTGKLTASMWNRIFERARERLEGRSEGVAFR